MYPYHSNKLPVPNIKEDDLEYSHKNTSIKKIVPPSIKVSRRNLDSLLNRSAGNLSALSVSFRGGDVSVVSSEINCSLYDKSSKESYFSQCFEKISVLGEGSFGEVVKVRSKEDGLFYAVKKSKQFFRSDKNRQQCLEEVRRYEQFSHHENCVTLIKAWEQTDRLYMQMELCQESLEQYYHRVEVVKEERIWEILLDLLLAIKCLHDKDLIHLDIKLDNILISDDNYCKLGDFGLVVHAKDVSDATEGDSRYMAPELLDGHYTKAADIFSLGVATLELTCDINLPLQGPLWHQLRNEIFPEAFFGDRSKELQMIIKSMMTSEYRNRPTVHDLLGHKKMVALLAQRRRWYFVKQIKKGVRKTKQVIFSATCRYKQMFSNVWDTILVSLRIKKKKEDIPCEMDSLDSLNVSNIEGSPIDRYPINNQIVNSTPVLCRARSRQLARVRNDDLDVSIDLERSTADSSDDGSFTQIRGKINF